MREIKFRAWAADKKIMLNGYCENSLLSGGLEVASYSRSSEANYAQDIKLMQFTGLRDKNGKEIYEGDILKNSYGDFYEANWKGCLYGKSAMGNSLSCDIPRKISIEFEVIGNIYQNPELIQQ